VFISGDTGGQEVKLDIQRTGGGNQAIGGASYISSTADGPVVVERAFITNVGSVSVNRIVGLYAGNITGTITCVPSTDSPSNNNITTLGAKFSLTGSVIVDYGRVGEISVSDTGGMIGTASAPATIRVRDEIGYLYGINGVHANIDGPNGLPPKIGSIAVGDGDIKGVMRFSEFYRDQQHGFGIRVLNTGNFTGTVIIQKGLPETIFSTPIAMSVPELGLGGQIIINAANNGYTWTGPVKVGTGIILDDNSAAPDMAPYYTRLPADLGGGSVGLVPFNLHGTACSPPHSPVSTCGLAFETRVWPARFGGGTRETIILRQYGPVFDALDGSGPDDPATKPLTIERQVNIAEICCTPSCSPCPGQDVTWTDRSDQYDVYCPANEGGTSLAGAREVWVSRVLSGGSPQQFGNVWSYRIKPRVTSGVHQLRCRDTGLPTAPPVSAWTYQLSTLCSDLNLSGFTDGDDLVAWADSPEDVNNDGAVEPADFVDLATFVNQQP